MSYHIAIKTVSCKKYTKSYNIAIIGYNIATTELLENMSINEDNILLYILPQEDAVLYSRSILPMEDMTILPVEEKSIFILWEDRSIISLYCILKHITAATDGIILHWKIEAYYP